MRRISLVMVLFATVALLAGKSFGVMFVSGVPEGTYDPGQSTSYCTTPAAALGKPHSLMGVAYGWPNLLTPFSPHFEDSEIVVIGQQGHITLQFPEALAAGAGTKIGVFTSAGLFDANLMASFVDPTVMAGQTGDPAKTFASYEYGVERTAMVEVAAELSDFRAVGRITFASPGNYYANVGGPYAMFAPANPVEADFGKPFTRPLADFSNKDFAGVLEVLDGSAGGTWFSLPAGLNLTEINYIRFSEPMWRFPDGTLVAETAALANASQVKAADLFIDGVAGVVPEPGVWGILMMGVGGVMLRRRSMRQK